VPGAGKMADSGRFVGAREVSKSGTKELPMGMESITGYTIINAESLDVAEKIARGNPYIASIRVYESWQSSGHVCVASGGNGSPRATDCLGADGNEGKGVAGCAAQHSVAADGRLARAAPSLRRPQLSTGSLDASCMNEISAIEAGGEAPCAVS
jgi:hypothetical protein